MRRDRPTAHPLRLRSGDELPIDDGHHARHGVAQALAQVSDWHDGQRTNEALNRHSNEAVARVVDERVVSVAHQARSRERRASECRGQWRPNVSIVDRRLRRENPRNRSDTDPLRAVRDANQRRDAKRLHRQRTHPDVNLGCPDAERLRKRLAVSLQRRRGNGASLRKVERVNV